MEALMTNTNTRKALETLARLDAKHEAQHTLARLAAKWGAL